MGFKLEHILVPVDFGAESDVAIERAVALAADYQADVTLLHVIEPPFFGQSAEQAHAERVRACELLRAIVQGKLRQLRKVHAWRGVAMTEVVFGQPADEILETADRLDAQTIVLAMRPHSTLSHAVSPSTTDRVIRRARCPVVVIRAPSWAHPSTEAEVEATEVRWGLAA